MNLKLLSANWVLLFSVLTASAGNKTSGTGNGPDKQLFLDLFTVDPGNVESLLDGLLVRYNTGFLASTADDADKPGKAGENISSFRELRDLSEEKRPLFYSTDTVFLHITNTAIKDYRFKIWMQQFSVTGLMAKIEDNYLHTSTILNTMGSTSTINFSITTDTASAAPFRFRIVIITARPLPVNITKFTAQLSGSGVQAKNIALAWEVSNQLNMLKYDVERSANGINFATVNAQTATTTLNHIYNWVDENALAGNNFYRVRCTGIAGDINYSSILKVKTGSTNSGINIYPNPVTNNIITLQFTGTAKGIYNIRLLNNAGQILYATNIKNSSNNTSQTIVPPNNLPKGNYYLEITGPDNLKVSRPVSVVK